MIERDDENPLPEMSEAVLSDDDVAALVRDLSACTQVNEILVKTGPGAAGENQQPTLDEAACLLLERSVRGVQIRYHYQGANWMDTLMPVANGIRLVRIRHDTDTVA
jgi:hypothetical protein